MSLIKIAVISDMHCMHSLKEQSPGKVSTYLYSDDIGKSENRHPVKALYKLIEKEPLKVDLLICPGDIANQADKQGLITGWSYLERIQRKLEAKNIVATVGNHDIESRNENIGNVFLDLQHLDRDYPIPHNLSTSSFWSYGYSVINVKDTLILNINSCFFHNNSTTAKKSKVDISQLEGIEKQLSEKSLDKFLYRIVLIHHHPIAHSNMDYEDIDKLDKGEELIQLIKRYKFQIIIHGHKHDSRLTIFESLPIFCAGSFSSLMNVTDLKSDNTFHIINLEQNEPKGFIESWIYAPQEGWVKRNDTRFPCLTGFGYIGSLTTLAKEINEWLENNANNKTSYYTTLLAQIGNLNYLGKEQQIELSKLLKEGYGLEFHPNFPNKPNVILPLIK